MNMQTSCTKDEAVAILLGWSDQPIRYRPASEHPTQEEWGNIPTFCLHDELDDRLEALKNDYAEAKFDGKPARDLKHLRSAINEFEKQIVLARTYMCDIDDEFAKGDSSALRVVPQSPKGVYESITLASLKAWVLQKYKRDILSGILIIDASQASKTDPAEKPRPRLKMLDQEDAILGEIRRIGHDPKYLPKNQSGKPGIKAKIREALKSNPLFDGSKVFNHAWDRLRESGEIANEE